MRVLVASAPVAHLDAARAGAALASAWAARGAELAVVPVAAAGAGFTAAWADLTGGRPVPGADGCSRGRAGMCVDLATASAAPSSAAAGGLLVRALAGGPVPGEVWLDAGAVGWADGGEGFWHALEPVRDALAGARLHLVVAAEQAELHLTGFRGITAVAGRAAGMHPGDMLAADQALVDWCATIGPAGLGTTPGSGAAGGLGAAVLALGGDVVTGPAQCARIAGLADTVRAADVVVCGIDLLDFGTKGGDVLPLVSELAEQGGRPLVVVTRHNWVSARELRTMGVEQAFSLCDDPAELPDAADVTARAATAARTWSW